MLRLPDEEAPDLEALDKALAWLDEVLYLGKKAYIHCRHGLGRTGTVLNAYLLRRGLGHRLAAKTLKKLRSKPESFDQWWFIRKYGRNAGKLTVRQPCLESKRQVDLAPFFRDYGELVSKVESVLKAHPTREGVCGSGHTRCCCSNISLTLIEALFVATSVDLSLSSQQRQKTMERASCHARTFQKIAEPVNASDQASGALVSCPLLKDEACILFDSRPLACRTFDLEPSERKNLWTRTLNPVLDQISHQIFFAYFSKFPAGVLPAFTLSEVICGRYVQVFFHWMMKTTAEKK